MKKKSKKVSAAKDDDLEIPETPPGFFKNAVMGKYYQQYTGGRGTVRIVTLEDDVAKVFQDSQAVNNVLRAIIANLPAPEARKRKRSA